MSLLELFPLRAVAVLHKPPLWHVLLLFTLSKWPELVLVITLVEILHRSSAAIMSLLNKPQKLQSIAVAFALSISFLLALTTSFSATHSNQKLFTELLKQFKDFEPIRSNSCALIVNISYAHLLPPPLQLLLPPKSASYGSWRLNREPRFRLKWSLENNFYRLASRTSVAGSLI